MEDRDHQEDTEDGTEESASSPPAASLIHVTGASPRPGSAEAPPPCLAVGGSLDAPEGGNDAKRSAVADGQPPSAVSQRYMPREVPPRFRNQQEPKVLLKRGQPPLSCMLLGGGTGGDATPRLPLQENADASDHTVDSVSLHSSSDTSATPIYANYTWGLGSGSQPSAQGLDKDNSNVEKWPMPEDRWNSDQSPARLGMDEPPGLRIDGSSELSKYAEANVLGGASSQNDTKEPIQGDAQHFNSNVPLPSRDHENTQSRNPSFKPDEPDGASSGQELFTHNTSKESPPALLSPTSALYQTRCKSDECITMGWVGLQVGPNDAGDVGVSCSDLRDAEVSGEKSADTGPQGAWDSGTAGSNKQAATGWSSVPSKEDVRTVSVANADGLQDSSTFAINFASRNDNQKAADDWDGSEGDLAGREGSEDGTVNQNLVQSPSRCQALHPEEELQSMISRTNLDPKVLCNTGWGKTQIKQNIAWDFEGDRGNVGWDAEENTDRCKEGWRDAGDPSISKMQKKDSPVGWTGHGESSMLESGWGEDHNVEDSCRRETTSWSQGGKSEWMPLPEGGGWKQERGSERKNPDEGLWGSPEESGKRSSSWGGNGSSSVKQPQGWGEKLPSQIPNKQIALKPQNQQSQTQQQMPGFPKALQENKGSGWTCGPIPQMPSVVEPSGWDEPSPQSISRKLEIDDGTSAWGDPTRYNNKSVNLWDTNSSQAHQQSSGRPAGTPSKNLGPATWTRNSGPSDQSMDSATGSWGKSFDAPTDWGESSESGKGGGWGNSHSHPAKTGSKSMQEGWGEDSPNASRHSSWEDEEGGVGVWGNRGSQNNMSTYNSGGWGQGQGARRLNAKSPLKGNSGDSWASPVTRQFSNMGITDEDTSMGHERYDRRGINDGDMRRGGRSGGAFRSQAPKESPMGESGPYMDKVGGHNMFGSGGIPPMRGMHQSGVHPLNSSSGIRAQVPHQFLPPQVPGPMLKPMAPPSGGMFPSQLSPQRIAMLGGIHPHMQQFQLACQILLQQQQQQQQQQQFMNQRKFPPPIRQQQDPQQLARIMAILQQQQGVGGPKLSPSPMGGHAPKHPDSQLHHLGLNAHKQSDGAGHAGMGGSELKAPAAFTGPVKLSGGSSFSQYDVLGGGWHRNTPAKVDTPPANHPWPPEFQPGVPWKGVQSPEPEPDPYMTPAGMMGSSVLSDTEHHLLQDNTGSNSLNTCMPSPGAWPYSASDPALTAHGTAKYSELKSSWPPEPIGHGKSWRTNRNASHMPRPPPGLTSQKQPWSGEEPRMPSGWVGGASSPEAPFKSEWSDGGASAGRSWLLLRNLTPQIDGSTLRTICLQHGPLLTFHLGLTQGSALIRYSSPHEAAKAQSALHMCVLGNTTIVAEFMSEEDVIRYFSHSQNAAVTGSPEDSLGSDSAPREGERPADGEGVWQGLDVSSASVEETPGLALLSQWSNSAGEGAGKGVWGGVAPGYHGGSLWGAPQLEDGTAALLPGNLLGGGADSL